MEYLKKLYQTNPCLRCINLDNRYLPFQILHSDIQDLAPFLPLLSKFEYLEELELAENALIALPANLSLLKGLASLTLTGNSFADIKTLAESLKTLPALKRLNLLPCEKEDRAILAGSLPQLEQINEQRNQTRAHRSRDQT